MFFWSGFEIALPLAVMGAASRDILRELDEAIDLSGQVDFQAIGERLAAGKKLSEEQVRDLLNLADQLPGLEAGGAGFLANASLGLGLRMDRFAFNSGGLYSAGAATTLDRTNLALGSNGIENLIPSSLPISVFDSRQHLLEAAKPFSSEIETEVC